MIIFIICSDIHHNHNEAGQGGDPCLLMASLLKTLLLIIIGIINIYVIVMIITCDPGQRESIERRGSLGRNERTLDLNLQPDISFKLQTIPWPLAASFLLHIGPK